MLEKDLICILEEEKKLLLSILELEERKKESLIDRNMDELIEVNKEEEKMFAEIDRYELSRNEIIKKLGRKFNLGEEITLTDLLDVVKDRSKLELLRDEILQIVEKIKYLSFENKVLIESSINVSMGIIEKVTNIKSFNQCYNKDGRKEIKVDLNTYSTIG